jgi:hypothetical protein
VWHKIQHGMWRGDGYGREGRSRRLGAVKWLLQWDAIWCDTLMYVLELYLPQTQRSSFG